MIYKGSLSDETVLTEAIRNGLTNEKMKDRALFAQQLTKSRHFTPEELLVRHVNLALKFPDLSHLTPNSRRLSVIEYYNLDVYWFLASLNVVFMSLTYFLVKKCCRQNASKTKKE